MNNPYGQMHPDHIHSLSQQACPCFQCRAEIDRINNAMQAPANGIGQGPRGLADYSAHSASESHD